MSETKARALEAEIYPTADALEAERLSDGATEPDPPPGRPVVVWARAIKALGYQVTPAATGSLLVAQGGGRKFDVWPNTERWRERDNALDRARMAWNRPARKMGYGLADLLHEMAHT